VTTVTIERKSSSSDLELLKTPISEAISDAGLSRSIPRYSPWACRNRRANKDGLSCRYAPGAHANAPAQ
jgi:hypothetical protein